MATYVFGKLSEESAKVAYGRLHGERRCGAGCGELATQWHHIFSQSKFPDLADHPDNLIAVCSDCHERHTNASKRLPRAAVAPAEHLASTPAMENYLERVYGAQEAAA